MKRLIRLFFVSVLFVYLQTPVIWAQDEIEHITLFYKDGLLNISCSAVPLEVVLQKISDKTATKFVFTGTVIAKQPVTLSLQQASLNKALKRLLRGYSYSSSFKNNIKIVTVFSSHSGKNTSNSQASTIITQTTTKPEPYIRPDTYIAPDTTIEVDEIIRPDDYIDPDMVVGADDTSIPDDGEINESVAEEESIVTDEDPTDTEMENELEDELVSLDDFMPLDLPPIRYVAYNEEDEATGGSNAEQYSQRAVAEQEMRLKRSLYVLASNHTNLYNDALNEIVGIDSYQATTALLQTATSEKGIDTTTKIVAAEGLWHHAADLGFSDPSSVAALQQMAQDSDPAVHRIGQQAIRDMKRYKTRQ